jgi:ribonuclease P protein component
MDQTFRKDERLRRSQDITEVLKTGTRIGKDGLSLVYLAREGSSGNRAGFIVRKKLGKAVSRNLMKRRMREAYRRMKSGLRPGYDLVFSANQIIEYIKVRETMTELMKKGLIAPEEFNLNV